MTRLASRSLPGRVLLALSKRLFDESVVTTIIMPVIADLQREVADAGDDRTRRRHARLRGYLAYWRVVMTVVFTIPTSSEGPLQVAASGSERRQSPDRGRHRTAVGDPAGLRMVRGCRHCRRCARRDRLATLERSPYRFARRG